MLKKYFNMFITYQKIHRFRYIDTGKKYDFSELIILSIIIYLRFNYRSRTR